MDGNSSSQWLNRRLDHIEADIDRIQKEINSIREEFRIAKESVHGSIHSLEKLTDDLPQMREKFRRQRGISEGLSFVSRALIALGATVSAIYAVWSIFGEKFVN